MEMAMASPQPTPHLTFRQNVTLTRPEPLPGRVVEYPIVTPRTVTNLPSARSTTSKNPQNPKDVYNKESTMFTPRQSLIRETLNKYVPLKSISNMNSLQKEVTASGLPKDDSEFQLRQRPWAVSGPSGQAINASIRKKRLESVNLKGNRKASRSSGTAGTQNGTASSCKRSDSATNDSQKSALTTESVEALQHTAHAIVSEERKSDSLEVEDEEVTEEEMERRRNIEKCMNWIDNLPDKFSGMYIVQDRSSTSDY